jgi:hypothetical protein
MDNESLSIQRNRLQCQRQGIDFQPGFGFFVSWHNGFDELPEGGGMVVVDQVAEFVDYDIIKNPFRGHNQSPVQVDPAIMMAAAPAASVVLYAAVGGGFANHDGEMSGSVM